MAVAVGGEALEPGVDDKVASRVPDAVDVDVGKVVLGRVVAGVPVPGGDQVVVLVGLREDRVIHEVALGEVVHEKGGGFATEEIDDISVGVEDGAPIRAVGRITVLDDVPLQLEQVVVVDGEAARAAGGDDEHRGYRHGAQQQRGKDQAASARESRLLTVRFPQQGR